MTGERVLVVDDNRSNTNLLRFLLVSEGYEVRTAADAGSAQVVLRDFLPHLILMDVQMPGMDGLTLTRLLKSTPRTAGILIVAVSAYAMKGDEEKALAAGCDGYVTKPIDTETLPAYIASRLATGAAGDTRNPRDAHGGGHTRDAPDASATSATDGVSDACDAHGA